VRIGVRAKLFFLSAALIFGAVIAIEAYVAPQIDRFLEDTAHVNAAVVAQAREAMWRLVGWGTVIALALALLVSNAVAMRIASAVGELTAAARRITEGDLSVRTRLPGDDELGELGHALDRLAGSLATTLGELRAERDLQKRILEAMHEGVVVVDRDGRIVLVNPAIRSTLLLGADAVGKLLIETVRHAQIDTMLDRAREAPEDQPLELELPGLKPRRLLVTAAPLSGDEEGLLLVFVDVTELRRLESLRRDFVANASHELRTPLTLERTLLQVALADPDASAATLRATCEELLASGAEHERLLESLLTLASGERGLELRFPLDLARIAEQVLRTPRPEVERLSLQVTSELGQAPTFGDPALVERLAANLIDNAVQHNLPAGHVSVRTETHEGRALLTVTNTGPVIPRDQVDRLLEPFQRLGAQRMSSGHEGHGLGLSIVRAIASAHDAALTVLPQAGGGLAVTVSFPGPGA